MVFIYILELENKKYYVGKTTNPNFRIDSHFNSNGSAWTKKYKPIRLYQLIPDCDDYDEDKYTKIYMDKYGIDNVRGGTYSQINLDENTIESLLKMNQTVTNKCYLCGKSGHFAKNCQKDNGVQGLIKSGENLFSCEYCDIEFTNKTKCYEHEYKCSKIFKNTCYKCGRNGHNINTCYATTDINNDELSESEEEIEVFCCYYCNKEFDTLKGATCHQNLYCKFKNNKSKSIKEKNKKNSCYKCGRDGHYSDDCYASKHVNGRYLN
jgi:cellular nucleic acid-binding protein